MTAVMAVGDQLRIGTIVSPTTTEASFCEHPKFVPRIVRRVSSVLRTLDIDVICGCRMKGYAGLAMPPTVTTTGPPQKPLGTVPEIRTGLQSVTGAVEAPKETVLAP